ncbi:TPA: pyruvate kinase [Candidatus Berkelbacteria bacterium]|uniref:Pyruvate kinase n=1 Tax=Berkelbacteria bacterium GW2011_GWE1_39_12 TaxID=1618337 RepID=A0A0G4B528_9BACT|nr:MAG: pyruvate kinase, pyruvate kinase [Berkelbacteria bacterium GW2011_GWE1_39_12]HBO60397.1 pyruvate kinase [Candidatus Berkelbacteria bacterium]
MRTKIICSIGPNTESPEKIKELIENGMGVARMNFSHDSHENHAKRIDLVRKWSKKLKKNVEILCDLQGPKIRIADFKDAPRKIHDGQKVVLTSNIAEAVDKEIMINDPYVHSDVKPKDIILIEDGLIELVVEKVIDHRMYCKVIRGGDIYPKKGVNLPLTKTTTNSITDKDKKDLEFILTKNPDWVAISFVQTEEDVKQLRQLMGNSKARVMCKIETAVAFDNIDSIIRAADGIMVARGDLGVEMPFEKLPILQKQIIKRCNYEGKPVVTATQMLSSMVSAPFATRAEVSDIANAVYDGTDAVMMSNETTVGKYPVEALITMRKVVEAIEDYIYHRENKL